MVTTTDLNLPIEIEESDISVRVSNDDVDDSSFTGGGGDGGGERRGSVELDFVSVSEKVSSDENERSGDTGKVCLFEEPVVSMLNVVSGFTLNDDDDVKVSNGREDDDDFEVKEARNDSVDERMESVDNDDRNDSTVERMDAKVERLDAVEHLESETDGSDETPRGSVDGFEARRDPFAFEDDPGGRAGSSGSSAVSQYDSMLSKFDDFVADEGVNQEVTLSKSMRLTLDPGEMVWGKVKSHPWWPGQIFSEALALSSVRRLKREGHVLVAFFGDSSYGWFDPSELVPFDYKFEEKSRQTSMKNFVKAVEEALDEASRRYALGLACKCRNPNNFSPSDVEGNFVVDVGDYPGGVYSDLLIEKARDSFQPAETLGFIRKLAMAPRDNDTRSLDMIKNTSKVFAYRKAVFEEFDETYSQAFGLPPEHPLPKVLTSAAMKNTPKAPLSGRLVIAEALGGRESHVKSKKVKDRSKKDKYLFKRRDVPNNSKSVHISEGRTNSHGSPGYLEGPDSPDFIIPQVIVNHEKGAPALSQNVARKQSVTIDASLDSNSSHEKDNDGLQKDYDSFLQQRDEGERMTPPYHEGYQQTKLNQEDAALDDSKSHVMSTGAKVKKTKYLKGPIGEMGSDNSVQGEKKKKRKKELGLETASEKKQKRLASGKFAGKSILIDGVDSHQSQKGNGTTKSIPDSTVDVQNTELEMPQLLHALRGLALDPFYGVERNWHTGVPPIFLRFRSLVFQKGASGQVGSSQIINDQPSKPPRPVGVKSDDPTKGGLKRAPSDRQEEKAAKKLKKIKDLKSLTAEKKAGLKNPEASRPEGKESMAGAAAQPPSKSGRSNPVKKANPPSRVADPTMLVMKFPATANLPSGNELRARFGRFGPLDHDGTRVFWKSFTCRVVFRYKADAENAYKFAVGNNSLFGCGQVRYYLKDTSDDASGETPSTTTPALNPAPAPLPQQPPVQLKSCLKKPGDEPAVNNNNGGSRVTPRVKFMLGAAEVVVNNTKFNNVGDDGSSSYSSSSSTSIGTDFSSNNFQKVIPPISSLPSVLPLPPHFAKPTQNMHFTEPLPPPPPLIRPATTTTTTTTTTIALPPPPPPPLPKTIDISQPMLNLLTRCKDVVSNISSLLGYVPYHPL